MVDASAKARKRIFTIVALVLMLAFGYRCLCAFVPPKVSLEAFLFASTRGQDLRSPDGSQTLSVYINDAGAMHSGNHWVWIVKDDIAFGTRVVVEGYITALERERLTSVPLTVTWNDRTLSVDFSRSRYGSERVLKTWRY